MKTVIEGLQKGPHVLITAGVHGDEYEPILTAARLGQFLKGKLITGKVTIVPLVNRLAYENASRFGPDGLDLARICPGDPNGSSSGQAAATISELIREADYLVDMHTGGVMYDIFPLVGYMLHENRDVLEKQRQMAISFPVPVIWGTEPGPDGRTLSVARDAGVPAVYLEYGGGTGIREAVIENYMEGCINLLRNLDMLDGAASELPLHERYWVEDSRINSGYLQGMMPSPADGIFQAEVKVGDQVVAGQCWGTIHDPLTGDSTKVMADVDGLAFLMRNLVKVKVGDALGGILPITNPGKITLT
ncbi:succinylglutamate desuccinylase/aspartoacylase family protein [Dyadobacter sp. CY323]|uniref:succinylglutamate desuccinylase/aspartoacylase family protein n=1 Tax=Dyadobacter sp. CY323 TaxID=2907302 RepID=UPI001F1E2FE1|nr:M14 family metallopeptidase [Dyadobacter sp. CY323]MCE6988570.1 M14 family metallopeptidase [Dyadobacter sp. CY323]